MLAALFFHGRTIAHLISSYGYGALFGTVAIESLGIPLPGETMLIAAALYAGATGHLRIWLVITAAAAGAVAGDNAGFAIGRYGGSMLLRRFGRYIRFDERRQEIGRYIFRHHGGKVVFFGRFVSVLRTYAAFLAGTNRMRWWRFFTFNATGGVLWATLYGVAYYYFGHVLQAAQTPLDVGLGVVAVLVVLSLIVHLKRKEREIGERAERELRGEKGSKPA